MLLLTACAQGHASHAPATNAPAAQGADGQSAGAPRASHGPRANTPSALPENVNATAAASPEPAPPASAGPGSPPNAAPTAGSAAAPSGNERSPAASASLAAGPRIISVATSPRIVHDGDVVRWSVRTSPDVVGVSAHVLAYSFPLQRRAAGSFVLAFAVPKGVPFFFHRTYDLDVVARTAAGTTARTTVGITFQ